MIAAIAIIFVYSKRNIMKTRLRISNNMIKISNFDTKIPFINIFRYDYLCLCRIRFSIFYFHHTSLYILKFWFFTAIDSNSFIFPLQFYLKLLSKLLLNIRIQILAILPFKENAEMENECITGSHFCTLILGHLFYSIPNTQIRCVNRKIIAGHKLYTNFSFILKMARISFSYSDSCRIPPFHPSNLFVY